MTDDKHSGLIGYTMRYDNSRGEPFLLGKNKGEEMLYLYEYYPERLDTDQDRANVDEVFTGMKQMAASMGLRLVDNRKLETQMADAIAVVKAQGIKNAQRDHKFTIMDEATGRPFEMVISVKIAEDYSEETQEWLKEVQDQMKKVKK